MQWWRLQGKQLLAHPLQEISQSSVHVCLHNNTETPEREKEERRYYVEESLVTVRCILLIDSYSVLLCNDMHVCVLWSV